MDGRPDARLALAERWTRSRSSRLVLASCAVASGVSLLTRPRVCSPACRRWREGRVRAAADAGHAGAERAQALAHGVQAERGETGGLPLEPPRHPERAPGRG